MPQRIDAWSFSRWDTYDLCPAKAKFKFLDKIEEKEGPALKRGKEIHEAAERHVGKNGPLTDELRPFAGEFEALRDLAHVELEAEWAFDREWRATGWFERAAGREAWCRVKVDVAHPVDRFTYKIIDHKSGRTKNQEKHKLQLDLYGLAGFLMRGVSRIVAELWYLDLGDITVEEYTSMDVPRLKKDWERRTKKMLADTRFAATPGQHCRWCPYAASKGGPCAHG